MKTFNNYFRSITDELEIFDWVSDYIKRLNKPF